MCITVVYTLLVCLFFCLYSMNVKTVKPISPNFVWGLTESQERFMNDKNYKNYPQANSIVNQFQKSTECFEKNSRFFVLFLF